MKAKEESGVAVSAPENVPENGQEDKKYWIKEDLEASRSILRAVSSEVTDLLGLSENEDAALAHCCSAGRLEAALTGRLTEVARGFEYVTDGCINQMHGDVATINSLINTFGRGLRSTEKAEALIHVCNRMVKSAKMIIEYEKEKAAKSVPSMDDVRHCARVLNAFMSSANDDEDELTQYGRLLIIKDASKRLGESAKNLANWGRRPVAQ